MVLNVEEIRKIDKKNMLKLLMDFPEQCEYAYKLACDFKLPKKLSRISSVIVTGLGGSAIGGDLLKAYLNSETKIPIVVNRNYILPSWVNKNTLIFAVSYSGNTEETISAYKAARKIGAKIICITTGGELSELSKKDNVPTVFIPTGYPPRTALGYLFLPILVLMNKLGLIDNKRKEIQDMIFLLRKLTKQYAPDVSINSNFAKKIATKLHNKPVVVYGVSDWTEAVALRWKGQLTENGKVLAFVSLLPEMNHNEVVGWDILKDKLKNFAAIFLRDDSDLSRIKKRIEITKSIITKRAGCVQEVYSSGGNLLSRLMSLICLGDFVSIYVAILNKVDPTPVAVIDYLKKQLKK